MEEGIKKTVRVIHSEHQISYRIVFAALLTFIFLMYHAHVGLSIDITAAELPYTVNEIQIAGVGTLKQMQVTEGDTISLTCKASTSDVAAEGITWAREEGPVSYNNVLLSANSNVSIQDCSYSNTLLNNRHDHVIC